MELQPRLLTGPRTPAPVIRWALLVLSAAVPAECHSAQNEDFLTRALHSLSTIESLSCEYTLTHSSAPDATLRYRFVSSEAGVFSEDRTDAAHPQMESISTEHSYHWKKNDGVIHASINNRREGPTHFPLSHTPELPVGLRVFDALGLGLTDVLTAPKLVVSADEHRITLSGFAAQRPGGALTVEAVFDPMHDYLPRLVQTTLTDAPPVPEGSPTYMQRWEVTEFFEISDQATGESRWFPRTAILTQGIPNSVTLKVLQASVNDSIPDSTFIPDLPVGSQVFDGTDKGGGGSYVVGVDGPRLDTRVDSAVRQMQQQSSSPGRFAMLIVFNVLAIILITVLIVWKRASR